VRCLLLILTCLAFPVAVLAQETETVGETHLLDLYDFDRRVEQFDLPGRLDEISGLAFTPDGRLFGHDDERGRVHHISTIDGEVGKRVTLGENLIRDDFEGIAIVAERFFLVSSGARIYEFREVEDRGSSPFVISETNLGRHCEVEGLDFDPTAGALLLACKESAPDDGFIVVHRVPMDPFLESPPPLRIAKSQLGGFGLDDDFDPSAIAVSSDGDIVLLAGRQESLIQVNRAGRVLAGIHLSKNRHPQPEGLAFGPDGTLYIADEKNGRAARVTAYRQPSEGGGP